MAVLTTYFDESYNQPNPKRPNEPLVYTVACWLSTVEKWKKFGKRWKRILKDAGLDFFHMTDYESRRASPYREWSDAKRLRVIQELLRAISAYRIYGCAVTVNCAAWDKIYHSSSNSRMRLLLGRNYYGFCVQASLRAINDWCDERALNGPIEYVFADVAKQGSVLDPMFKMLNADPKFRKQYRMSGTWTKGIMKRVVQLQAADVIAYEVNKRAANHFGSDPNYLRRSLASLDLGEHFHPLYFGDLEIRKWLKMFKVTGF